MSELTKYYPLIWLFAYVNTTMTSCCFHVTTHQPVLQPGVHSEILVMRGDAPESFFETDTKSKLKSFVLILSASL